MWGGGHTRPALSRGQLGTQHRKGGGIEFRGHSGEDIGSGAEGSGGHSADTGGGK